MLFALIPSGYALLQDGHVDFINAREQGNGAVGSWVVVAFSFVDRNALN